MSAGRPTSAHETIWLLTKSAHYFWDAEAVREPVNPNNTGDGKPVGAIRKYAEIKGANCRNVWHVASQPFEGAHFATMPPEIVERCIKAGSPRKGHVLDPFAGAGTTGLVADRLGRDCTLIDLNTEYAEMALNRIRDDAPLFAEVTAE